MTPGKAMDAEGRRRKAANDLMASAREIVLKERDSESQAKYLRTIAHAEAMRGLLEELTDDYPDGCDCASFHGKLLLCAWCKARALLATIDGGGE